MYDFKAARQHQAKLAGVYRALKRQNADPEALAWVASEYSCMEMEIAEAHKEKIALHGDSFHSNILMHPILTHG